jgi:hypothetical protein
MRNAFAGNAAHSLLTPQICSHYNQFRQHINQIAMHTNRRKNYDWTSRKVCGSAADSHEKDNVDGQVVKNLY